MEDINKRIRETLELGPQVEISLEPSKMFLSRHIDKKVKLATLVVDIDSSKLNINIERIIQLFAQEISLIINKYIGYLLNYIEGSFIAFFPAEFDEKGACMNAIAASQEILHVIDEYINPELEQRNYPKIEVSASIHFGSDLVISYDKNRSNIDIIGSTINTLLKMPAIYHSIIITEDVYKQVDIKDHFMKLEPSKLYKLSTNERLEACMNCKAIVYKAIDEINADEIKDPSFAIKEILNRAISEEYDKNTYRTIVTTLMHFVLSKFLIPSERKVEIDDQVLDIIIPSSKVLREEPEKALILAFPDDMFEPNKLSKLQPNKENIWLIFGYPINKQYDYRTYSPDQFGTRALSSIINDIEEFLRKKNVKKFKILPS